MVAGMRCVASLLIQKDGASRASRLSLAEIFGSTAEEQVAAAILPFALLELIFLTQKQVRVTP